ncbi:Gfo/Idh/MocA family protein [Larkinella sp. C7]|jgi:UDP-N-acetyl-2-amino-2-deoxyglucuronate dehydrogenase|uniref:Gfo/Idh/MocA family protein n=1 Tax=Larkinella sp. C7 TaxID=2576607 RepID=UPI0011113678|nr:Gfo/Idh/MocA family oxidoreductase [Larkinella sp. C7]
MSRILNIALIGPGKVAHNHARATLETPDTKLVAIYGRNHTKADEFANQYGITAYSDIYDMVDRENVDICIVCTPHPAHRVVTVAALEAGANVLVEKPLASSLADCDAMINAARNANRQLAVVSQRRFYEPCMRMRQAIDDGKIGKPVLGMAQLFGWRSEEYYRSDPWRGSWEHEGGGVLVNQAPHQLDLLLWYMGEMEEVYGVWANLNHPDIEVDDTAVAIVRFKNGGIGNVIVSNSQKPGLYGKVHIHGQNGASIGVQTDGGSMFIAGMTGIQDAPYNDVWSVVGEEDQRLVWKAEDDAVFNSVDSSSHYFSRQLADFGQAIRDGRQPLVTGEEGRKVVALFEAIYESTRTRQPVRLSS